MSSIVLSADPYTEGPAPLIEALRRAVPERAARARAALKQAGTLYPEPPTVEVFVTSSVVFERCKMQVLGGGEGGSVRLSRFQTSAQFHSAPCQTSLCSE